MATPEASGQKPRWRELTADERQVQYSPSSCTGGTFEPFIAEYKSRSEQARQAFASDGPPLRALRYGHEPANTVDLIVPEHADETQPVPLLVYIHGGYWQLLSKNESLFAAQDCVANGIAFAALDYTLAPMASLDEIVAECHIAMSMLRREAPALGIDPDRIVVCGSSAGAHLSAMVGLGSSDRWRPAAVGLLSGVFELEPLIGTTINNAVGLDANAAKRNSPLLFPLDGFPRTIIAWGENETDEFKLQSTALGSALADKQVPVETLEIAGRNHFDVVLDLCNPSTPLGRAILALVEGSGGA